MEIGVFLITNQNMDKYLSNILIFENKKSYKFKDLCKLLIYESNKSIQNFCFLKMINI